MTVPATSAAISVFETSPFWGPELHRRFVHTDVAIQECRSLGDVLPAVAEFDSALVVIDIESSPELCLNWLVAAVDAIRLRWPVIACASDATLDLEWRFRDAGVTAFLPRIIPGETFASLCRRQLGIHRRGRLHVD